MEIHKNRIVYKGLQELWYTKHSEEGRADSNNELVEYPYKQYPDVHHNVPKIKFLNRVQKIEVNSDIHHKAQKDKFFTGVKTIGFILFFIWSLLLIFSLISTYKIYQQKSTNCYSRRYMQFA